MNRLSYRNKVLTAFLLVVMYTLHLGVFNALMAASFQIKDNLCQFCFDDNSQTNNAHRCLAADYQRLLKHEDDKKHTFAYEPTSLLIIFTVLVLPVYGPAKQRLAVSPLKFFHLPDDAFERYRLLNVFLI